MYLRYSLLSVVIEGVQARGIDIKAWMAEDIDDVGEALRRRSFACSRIRGHVVPRTDRAAYPIFRRRTARARIRAPARVLLLAQSDTQVRA